ncbi:DUF6438 domain-containing protein [Sphingobium boeckii]|uniref:DUF6438 domain-containing protein n=1 Tax=Sphingobium boeckii TaxID=1082345 RepID=A0A7W9EEI3_9SPHN|nr:DUF6438 domain-containing protein [Sphingobium boeckii]MBB5685025.1 hypothetical protein [Sphingobium boeckii]
MTKTLSAALALLATSACTPMAQPGDAPVPLESDGISIAVGPCFGFCPVYEMGVDASGRVTFHGERLTAVLGPKAIQRRPDLYAAIVNDLARYKPMLGKTSQSRCDQQISDQQHITITWHANIGQSTALRHDKGCRSSENDRLNRLLDGLPSRLGMEDWTKQTRRTGTSRG